MSDVLDEKTVADLLPLGSIVTIEGSERKLMVVGRALAVAADDRTQELYDYAMVVYPFGIIGDALVYTNHDEIREVIFEGFADEEDAEARATIAEALQTMNLSHGDPRRSQPHNPEADIW